MVVVLVGMGMAKGDTVALTSDSIHFNTRRTGVSDITTTTTHSQMQMPRHRASRHHTQPDADLDLHNLPTARAIALPGGNDWPLGNKGHSLDVAFSESYEGSSRSSAAIEKEKGRFSDDQLGREYPTQRAGGSSSALDTAV
jgi:hypothetical protein